MSHTPSSSKPRPQQAYNYNQEVLKWMEELRLVNYAAQMIVKSDHTPSKILNAEKTIF